MPNTRPVNDNTSVTELMLARAAAAGAARVYPVGCISKGQGGEELAEYGELKAAGCVALSDDGKPVMSAALMRRALEYARAFGLPLTVHEEDLRLVGKGVMHEGAAVDAPRPEGHPRRRRGGDGAPRHRARGADRRPAARRARLDAGLRPRRAGGEGARPAR